jgi:hypothetical protein
MPVANDSSQREAEHAEVETEIDDHRQVHRAQPPHRPPRQHASRPRPPQRQQHALGQQ